MRKRRWCYEGAIQVNFRHSYYRGADSVDYQGFPIFEADEVASLIPHGAMVAFSGFTPAGAAKAIPRALARRACDLHAAGLPFQLRVLTGASTGRSLDEALAQAEAISWRAPYQSSATLRDQINRGDVDFVDMHLSQVPQSTLGGFFGKVDFAVIEASDITPDGRVYLTTSVGASPAFLHAAEHVIVELNRREGHHQSPIASEGPSGPVLWQVPPCVPRVPPGLLGSGRIRP